MSAIRALLTESIDYAGLFPPAGLDMASAVKNYAQYRAGPDAWALGRFVVPVSRLPEFEAALAGAPRKRPDNKAWPLALLAGADPGRDLEAVTELTRRHSEPGSPHLLADAIELKASSLEAIEDIMHRMPRTLQAYVEVPIDRDPEALLLAITRLGGRAKVRTGGVTRDAFPKTSDLLRFLRGCVRADLPFKATAGLHHPLRAEYRLTYAPDSPTGVMFGFLNVFLATAFLRAGLADTEATRLLEERAPDAFQIDEDGISWQGHRLDLEALRDARRRAVVSFGSCSFTEPIGDLEALHLLGPGART